MRQASQDPQQLQFREILLRLRDAKVTVADWNCLMTRTPTHVQISLPLPLPSASYQRSKLLLSTMLLNFMLVASQLPPSRLSTLDPMQQKHQLMMQEDWRQSFVWPCQLVSCSPATSGLTLVLSVEQWELFKPYATALEDHLISLLLSWSILTATLALLFTTALCPSLLFAAAGLHQDASAHVCSCLSSWHGQSPSISLRV